ncbi:hypothetical protein Btru_003542 [Bulinus truncatus]|nr:hypothetical protein Btru_003542 [Bulinus truncatus]
MAAEIRNQSSSESLYESSTFSEAFPSSIQSTNSDDKCIPSYLIVKKQIEDVILTQRAAVDQLVKYNIEIQNASRESLDATILSQEEKIKQLEKSIVEDYVLKEAYESLQSELKENYIHIDRHENLQTLLQNEYERHGETQAKLHEVVEKFNSCLLDIEKLEFQLKEKTLAFTQAYGKLEKELSESHVTNRNLEQLVKEMTIVCETQKQIIQQKENQILDMERKNSQHVMKLEQKVRDSVIEKQQEACLNKMFSNGDKKKKT